MLPGLSWATRQKNTTAASAALLLSLVLLSWWLFGLVWSLILCAASALCYCATSYVCYRPEAVQWREAIQDWYQRLFIWGFNYTHLSASLALQQGSHSNASSHPKGQGSSSALNGRSTPFSHERRRRMSADERRTRGEFSSGGAGVLTTPLGDARPPQPQAAEQDSERRGGAAEDEGVQPMKGCHKEAQKLIQLIMKDFVQSWYTNVTSDSEFPDDAQKILEHIALEINVRLQQVDMEEAIVDVLELILPYLEVLNQVGIRNYSGMELFDVSSETCVKQFEADPRVAHYALKTTAHEQRHYRQLLDVLLQCAVPGEYSRCDVACTLIREVLITNIFNPLFDLLCEPAFLYEAIPIILAKASPDKIERQLSDIQRENEELERILNRGRLIFNIMGGTRGRSLSRRFHTSSGWFGSSAHYSNISSPNTGRRGHGMMGRPHSMATFPNMTRTSSGIYESNSWLTQSSQTLPRHSTSTGELAEATYPPPTHSPKRFNSPPINGARPQGRDLLSYQNTLVEDGEFAEEEEEVPENFVDGEFAVVELSPIYIERHVRVDTGDTQPHIAYIFKFPKWMLSDEDLLELEVLESDTHLEGMKRYSEFSKFHNILMASPLSINAKGLALPKKRNLQTLMSKFPFGNSELDATVVIERKQGLEKYLQSVSSVEAIVTSEVFRQFLKSGVRNLKEANVVNPNRSKKQNRISFLGRVKGSDGQKAEPVPQRSLESVLSSYLNTHLPLPCPLNSIHSMKTRPPPPPPLSTPSTSAPPSASTSPTKPPTSGSSHMTRVSRHSRTLLSGQDHSPGYSLASSGSTSSLPGSTRRTHSEHTSLHQTDNQSSSLDTLEARHGSPDDVNLPDGGESSRGSFQRPEEEEEGQTIGGSRSSSSLSNSSSQHRPSLPRSLTTTPVLGDYPLAHTRTQPVESATQQQSSSRGNESEILPRLRSLACKFLVCMHKIISWVIFIMLKGLEPYSDPNLRIVIQIEKKRSPLTNALFCLGSEASARHCPRLWVCAQNTQLSLLVLAGGGMERYLWRELRLVVCDEVNWTRALYTLRHTLWPEGKFLKSSRKKVSEAELEQLKRKAADAFKKFLPNFLPHIVGDMEYDRAVVHCLDFLRNPRLTRHFLLRVVDLIVVKIIPEIRDKRFQKQLSQLRTRQSSHSSHS